MKVPKKILLVVGMARSGTTLVANLLGSVDHFHVEIEPHVLWKSGNLKYLNDEEYDLNQAKLKWIRQNFLKKANGRDILEKSPINSLRPELVHAVFPEATIIYIQRDPVRCIYSNYKRSIANDSFKPSIILKKYFYKVGSTDLPHATSDRKIFSQIRWQEAFSFGRYLLWMLYQRNTKANLFPFGPKLKDFINYVDEHGLLSYHTKVLQVSNEKKEIFKKLYPGRLHDFQLDTLLTDPKELKRLFDAAKIEVSDTQLNTTFQQIDHERKSQALQANEIDKQIRQLLREKAL